MNILFLTNNLDIPAPLYEWLQQQEGKSDVMLWSKPLNVNLFRDDKALSSTQFIVSYNYSHIIKPAVLGLFPHQAVNLHISLLPWNRGSGPNVWSFLDNTPCGITIHEIDSGIDTGCILLQKQVYFEHSKDTLESSYNHLHKCI